MQKHTNTNSSIYKRRRINLFATNNKYLSKSSKYLVIITLAICSRMVQSQRINADAETLPSESLLQGIERGGFVSAETPLQGAASEAVPFPAQSDAAGQSQAPPLRGTTKAAFRAAALHGSHLHGASSPGSPKLVGGEGPVHVRSLSSLASPNPERSFEEQPAGGSVAVGQLVVMRCKTASPVRYCRWYHLPLEEDFYSAGSVPSLVKEFTVNNGTDCSIRFIKVRAVQEGQWLCQARRTLSTTVLNSRPAPLNVVTVSEAREYEARNKKRKQNDFTPTTEATTLPTTTSTTSTTTTSTTTSTTTPSPTTTVSTTTESVDKGVSFSYEADEHIQNTRTGASATLPCRLSRPVAACAWQMPSGALLSWADGSGGAVGVGSAEGPNYRLHGDPRKGDCALTVRRVGRGEEGDWRCIVTVDGPEKPMEVEGPRIHLHLLDFHHSHNHNHAGLAKNLDDNSESSTGVVVGVLVGLVVVAALVAAAFLGYKRLCVKTTHFGGADPEAKAKQDPNGDYAQQWFQGRNFKVADPNHTDDFKLRNANLSYNTHNGQINYADPNYQQYLKMKEHEESIRSSASSNATLMTHMTTDPDGRDRSISFGTNNRYPVSSTGPPNRPVTMPQTPPQFMPQFSPQFMPQSPPPDMVPDLPRFKDVHQGLQRPTSLYSTGHLYEEIKDKSRTPTGANVSFNAQGILVDVNGVPIPGQAACTPVYANEQEDQNGYLMPNKSNKVVNTPTEEGNKYLVMQGEPQSSPFMNSSRLSESANLNNNIQKPHFQVKDIQGAAVHHDRRCSNDSTLSNEENTTPDKQVFHAKPYRVADSIDQNDGSMHSTPQLSNSALNRQMPQSMHSTPNFHRQRMPLPSTPKSAITNEDVTFPLNKQFVDKKLHMVSFQHQRASSLPDTSNPPSPAKPPQPPHSRSPSVELPQESYDVPRSLGNLPTSLRDSAGSIDDINGTIV